MNPPVMQDGSKVASSNATRDHLANERTYLAWTRTALTVLGLGFVVGKFGVWLRYMAAASPGPALPSNGPSVPLAIGIVLVGAVLAVVGAWRYRRVRRAIETGMAATAGPAVAVVTVVVVAVSILMLVMIARPH